jgi:transposase-like protein
MTPQLAEVGQFCPNEACEFHQDIEKARVIQYGKTAKGTQRYLCKHCNSTFVETKGTLFYGKHTPRKDILETLALLAEGVRISSLSRAKGFKEDTILGWLREAAEHAEQVEAVLMDNYEVSQAQIDGLWAYVGHKGQKGATPKAKSAANSGAAR